ncbi:MAG: hypothetical protein GY723_01585, partial [bacterium]|nr:hypothetical protein [bacterium]
MGLQCTAPKLLVCGLWLGLLTACGGTGGSTPPSESSIATLAGLVPSFGSLTPAFDPSVTTYTIETGRLAPTLRFTPTVREPSATVVVQGLPTASTVASPPVPLALGPTPVTLEVTAGDGVTQERYIVVVLRASLADPEAYVKAPAPVRSQQFGSAVALSGDTLVVGARNESSSAMGIGGDPHDSARPISGAVFVFVRTARTSTQQAHLKASTPDPLHHFGASVALSGDNL